jgi:hypothetical protein
MHSKTKHIPIKYHFLRQHIAELRVKLEYIATKEQVAYIFTKSLPRETFEYLRQNLGVISLSSSQYRSTTQREHTFSIDVKGGELQTGGEL